MNDSKDQSLKIDDVSQIKHMMIVRIKSLIDNNPFKASVHNYIVKNKECEEPRLSFVSRNSDSYSDHNIRYELNNDLLNDPTIEVKFYEFLDMDALIYAELSFDTIARDLTANKAFHQSNYFKFDIDGQEYGGPGYKFSEMKPLPSNERFVFKNGNYHVTTKERHRPIPLRIAKYETPITVELKNGKNLKITHITELGELIYNAQGLKSVNKMLITDDSLEALTRKTLMHDCKFAPALESFLVGDTPQYRQSFLDRENKASMTPSM